MIAVYTETFDLPLVSTVLVTSRESIVVPRIWTIRNLSSRDISFQIQGSATGLAWVPLELSDGTTEITLGRAGGGNDVAVERITYGNLQRVEASGGSDCRDVTISLSRSYTDTVFQWAGPFA